METVLSKTFAWSSSEVNRYEANDLIAGGIRSGNQQNQTQGPRCHLEGSQPTSLCSVLWENHAPTPYSGKCGDIVK